MSHQNLKNVSEIHIGHKRNKVCQNQGFLKNNYFMLPDTCKIWLLKEQVSSTKNHLES